MVTDLADLRTQENGTETVPPRNEAKPPKQLHIVPLRALSVFETLITSFMEKEISPEYQPSQQDYFDQIHFFARNLKDNFVAVPERSDSISLDVFETL